MFLTPIQVETFATEVQMRRIDPARNMRRFYRMSVQRDLFGRASVVREWGRIGFRGQMMVEIHPDESAALIRLKKLAAIKMRRGYETSDLGSLADRKVQNDSGSSLTPN